MVALDEHTVAIFRTTGLKDRVSRDRIVKAPSPRTEHTGMTPLDLNSLVDSETEPTPPTAIDFEAATSLPVGAETHPTKVQRDPNNPERFLPTSTDPGDRDTNRDVNEIENATHYATVTQPLTTRSETRNVGSLPSTGPSDALRGDAQTRITSQVNPIPATVGEEPLSKDKLPLP